MTEPEQLSDKERLAWIRLSRSENIGPKTFYQLVELYGNASKAMEAVPEMMVSGGSNKKISLCDVALVEKELEACERVGAKIIVHCETDYPSRLKHIADPPPVLTVLGDASHLSQDGIAIVGARNATTAGSRMAYGLASKLGEAGFVVISGLARGIDTAAHKGALKTGTVAVVAGGIDVVYPPENKALFNQIVEEGVVVAESAFGAVPRAESFPRRNRLISGISMGTVIVEATVRSGSLITARLAGEQGREVMAVPGFPLDSRAEGPNKLIKQGATLVENAKDIIEAIGYSRDRTSDQLFEIATSYPTKGDPIQSPPDVHEVDDIRLALTRQLGSVPVTVDDLIATVNASVPAVQTALLELELAGRLTRHPGGRVSLA